jgi:hypothetical protein
MIKIEQYDYEGLIKSYLAQDRLSAKTAYNRLSYRGIKLFSYNSKLAIIGDKSQLTLYIDKAISKYSNTTQRQTRNLLHIAAEHNWTVFIVNIDKSQESNLIDFWNDIESLITRYKRARTRKPSIKQSIHKAVSTAQHFAEWHELDPTIPDLLMRQLFVNQLLK